MLCDLADLAGGVRLLGDRRTLAATLMALLVAALLVAPFVAVGLSLADNVSHLAAVLSRALEHGPPDPPAWVADLPWWATGCTWPGRP